MKMRVKICCIASVEEARLAIRQGASALGLVSAMPSGPGPIPEGTIAEIARAIPPGVASFLLTALQDAPSIIAQQRRCGTSVIQLVDAVPFGDLREIRRGLPGIGIVQVIHVTGESSIAEAAAVAPLVDALLLDSGNPTASIKELGGTGRRHDWSVSRRLVERVACPVYLAGGLRPENVGEAIGMVAPFGLDLCSGVRTGGLLDAAKLAAFFAAVTAAD